MVGERRRVLCVARGGGGRGIYNRGGGGGRDGTWVRVDRDRRKQFTKFAIDVTSRQMKDRPRRSDIM